MQAVLSCIILLLAQIQATATTAYQVVVDAAVILYFIPFLYMYAAAIKLAYRKDRRSNPHAVLIPGGVFGAWIAGGLGFLITALGIALSFIPPGGTTSKFSFLAKLIGGTVGTILFGLVLYWRGAREKSREAQFGSPVRAE